MRFVPQNYSIVYIRMITSYIDKKIIFSNHRSKNKDELLILSNIL